MELKKSQRNQSDTGYTVLKSELRNSYGKTKKETEGQTLPDRGLLQSRIQKKTKYMGFLWPKFKF